VLRGVQVVGVGGVGTLREACGVMWFFGGIGLACAAGRRRVTWGADFCAGVCCGGCFALLWCLKRLLAFDRERDMDGRWLRLA